jgi:hypothetical protein
VRDHIDPGLRRELAALDCHRVGEDALAMLVRLVGNCSERLDVHRGFLGQLAIAPAVGERLDMVGPISLKRLHLAPRALGGRHPFGGVGVGPIGAVAPRRAHACDEIDVRRVNIREPGTARREGLGLLVKIVHRRHAARKIGVRDLWQSARRPRRTPMGVDVDEAREERLAVGANDFRARRDFHVGADRLDPPAAHNGGAAKGFFARRVEDRRAGDRDDLVTRFGEH